MTVRFLGVEQVIAIHTNLIDDFGGSHGLRDPGLLESAVLRAENRAVYEPEVSVAGLAASLSWGLIKNHAFIDGNKRVGLAALIAFVEANGFSLTIPEEDAKTMVLRVAASEIGEGERAAWVKRSVAPIGV
ncbi:MAG: type II toxin-antitoxin system death-on-curing family toxin [Acidobacteriota bacterium]|nr:type II toxin-antitoxin system death-on-curing family toxin [Acidobacteriota bacterium]